MARFVTSIICNFCRRMPEQKQFVPYSANEQDAMICCGIPGSAFIVLTGEPEHYYKHYQPRFGRMAPYWNRNIEVQS